MRAKKPLHENLRRPWTGIESERLLNLFESGHTYPQIAHALNRTVFAVEQQQHRMTARIGGRDYFLVADIARIMGVSKGPVKLWIRRGWLQSTRSGMRASSHGSAFATHVHHISRDQFTAFLSHEQAWGYWFVDRVQSGYWRNLATALRGNARLITTIEAGKLLAMSDDWVCVMVNRGQLPFVRGVSRIPGGRSIGRATWIRADLISDEMVPKQRERIAS